MSPPTYDTWLVALREDNESLPSVEEQQAFLDFLNQKTTAEEAALAYTHIVSNAKIQDPESLWILVWEAAQEWPETHQSLVDLLKAISRLPPIARATNAGRASKSEYWKELPEFEFLLREYWDGGELTDTSFLKSTAEPSVQGNKLASSTMRIPNYTPISSISPRLTPAFSVSKPFSWRVGP